MNIDLVKIENNFLAETKTKLEKHPLFDESLLARIKQGEDAETEVKAPEKQVVTSQISGIEIMDLEDAVKLLWKNGIYAESGIGCTGPIILVNDVNTNSALKILADNEFIGKEQLDC